VSEPTRTGGAKAAPADASKSEAKPVPDKAAAAKVRPGKETPDPSGKVKLETVENEGKDAGSPTPHKAPPKGAGATGKTPDPDAGKAEKPAPGTPPANVRRRRGIRLS